MALLLQGGVRRSSVGLSDRLKKFESGGNDSAANSTKPAFKEPITRPGKVICSLKPNLFKPSGFLSRPVLNASIRRFNFLRAMNAYNLGVGLVELDQCMTTYCTNTCTLVFLLLDVNPS